MTDPRKYAVNWQLLMLLWEISPMQTVVGGIRMSSLLGQLLEVAL